jgi:hypothetical protein
LRHSSHLKNGFGLDGLEWSHLILFVFGIPILLRVAERSRIREAVRQMLGTVITLRRKPFWQQGWDYYSVRWTAPKYEVTFRISRDAVSGPYAVLVLCAVSSGSR